MKFEHHSQPVLPFRQWVKRVIRSVGIAGIMIVIALAIGIIGYHITGGLNWVDSILEASMILGGMGPVAPMNNDTVKLFASAYAMFSGLVILSTAGVVLAPMLHRLMHNFHGQHGDKK